MCLTLSTRLTCRPRAIGFAERRTRGGRTLEDMNRTLARQLAVEKAEREEKAEEDAQGDGD